MRVDSVKQGIVIDHITAGKSMQIYQMLGLDALAVSYTHLLEQARAEKKIGKSLEAKVAVTVPVEDAFMMHLGMDYLADLFIVSQVEMEVDKELTVDVFPAEGEKCPRCWKFHPCLLYTSR